MLDVRISDDENVVKNNQSDEDDDQSKMKGRQKAAALLIALGSDTCAKIFKELNSDEVELIASDIAQLKKVDNDTMKSVFREFLDTATSGGVIRGGVAYATEALSKALGAEDTMDTIDRIKASSTRRPFDHLTESASSIELLLEMIKEEHPQTIALILAHVKEQRAAQILPLLPEEIRVDVITRIANMTTISPEVISQIEDILNTKSQGQERVKAGGAKAAAEILNRVEAEFEKQVMDSITESNPELAERISEHMFTYDDIILISDTGIQKLLQEIEENDLLMALKASTEAIQEKIYRNMSDRRQNMIQEDLEKMPPAKLKDVLAAQKRILAVAKEMSQDGQIEIVRDSQQEVYI
ncbi:flagellar motor switch protein FliG [Candidatus Poribacteria bacterium]|nr:flagellar motor switch protein FliG [Candidatus Poribacteria bacterium]